MFCFTGPRRNTWNLIPEVNCSSKQENQTKNIAKWPIVDASKSSKKTIVILLASMPRSGSTMMAELLKSRKNTVLFFEPDHKTEFTSCSAVVDCMCDYIRNILLCKFDAEFEKWQKSRFFNYFHESTQNCFAQPCKLKMNLRKMCNNAEFAITKLIRVPLGYLENLIKDPMLETKIIHLIRDPRGSLISNKKMGWVHDPFFKCSSVHMDLLAYEHLSEKYPGNVIQVKYEKFCLNPLEVTKNIFKFAFGDQKLSNSTLRFIKEHTEAKSQTGAMNTVRESKNFYQDWRWKITPDMFDRIEKVKECQQCLNKLNYRVFGSIQQVRNQSLSLFLDSNNKY